MDYESMSQAIASIRILQRFYSVIRVRDKGSTEILYDSENSDMPSENPVSFTGRYDAVLTINDSDHTMVITTAIPVSIGDRIASIGSVYTLPYFGHFRRYRNWHKMLVGETPKPGMPCQ